MRISGRSCMSFYTRQTKIRSMRCVRCGPVDAYLYAIPIYFFVHLKGRAEAHLMLPQILNPSNALLNQLFGLLTRIMEV
uniref:SFRICE_008700 n=1 Tax=Spodoptera frugiperda TaxID=7108 RepID=A0A2H1V076_SPOFR